MFEPEWILADVVDTLHFEQIKEHGGTYGLRDKGLPESALGRPKSLFAYGEPDLCALAASYAHGIAKNHVFLDGNKRTAAICCELFLNLNGIHFTVDEVVKYPRYLALASGDLSEEDFAAWLRTVTQ